MGAAGAWNECDRSAGGLGAGVVAAVAVHTLLWKLLPAGAEAVRWEWVACLLSRARFCAQPSEWAVAERWHADSAGADWLGVAEARINEPRWYRGLALLVAPKGELGERLLERDRSWFGTRFKFLICAVTSTYCAGAAVKNDLAARGITGRIAKPVCLGWVATPEGVPVADDVFAGNRADVTTVAAMVELLEKKYRPARRVWVMDRGMVSAAHLTWLRGRGALDLAGTPKSQLRQFEKSSLDTADWHTVRGGWAVKLVAAPGGTGCVVSEPGSGGEGTGDVGSAARPAARGVREDGWAVAETTGRGGGTGRRRRNCLRSHCAGTRSSGGAGWRCANKRRNGNGRDTRTERTCCAPTTRRRTRRSCGGGMCR